MNDDERILRLTKAWHRHCCEQMKLQPKIAAACQTLADHQPAADCVQLADLDTVTHSSELALRIIERDSDRRMCQVAVISTLWELDKSAARWYHEVRLTGDFPVIYARKGTKRCVCVGLEIYQFDEATREVTLDTRR